jgi:putative ABC transport system substrate-binding protein
MLGSPLINQIPKHTVELLAAHHLPAISPFRSFPEIGGMMSYGPVLSVWVSRAGRYTSSNLKGAKPAELPVEQPAKFEFVVNLTAP